MNEAKRIPPKLGRTQWPWVPLPRFVFFQEGPGLRKWQWTSVGMKVVNVTNILSDGSVDVSNTTRHIAFDEFKSKYSHFEIQDGDIVLASSGNTYGKVGRIKRAHLPLMMNTSVVRLRPKSCGTVNAEYLFSFLRSPLFRDQVERFVTGSAQPNFGPSHLKLMWIPLPNRSTQERIAFILSAYDDLIENNTRRIKILEEMAQMLYREWFVNFRFPGHENVRMVDSELGPIPSAWRVGRLDEALVLQRGFDLPKNNRSPGDVPIVSANGHTGTHSEAKVKGPGVVTGRSGSLGTVMFVHEDFWPLNTTLWVKEFRRSNPPHAYFTLENIDLGGFNSGAAVPTLNRNDIHGYRTVLPDPETLAAFSEIVSLCFMLKRTLLTKNTNLRTTRDLLLPKLISGEIPVETAEEQATGLVTA